MDHHTSIRSENAGGITLGIGSEQNALRPGYYGGADNPYEVVKVIYAWDLGFSLGNVVKYIRRAGKKDPKQELSDLRKARTYLDIHIKHLEGSNP